MWNTSFRVLALFSFLLILNFSCFCPCSKSHSEYSLLLKSLFYIMWCGIPWPEFSPSFPSGSSWISPASTPAHETICYSSLQFNSFVLTDLRVLRSRTQEEHRTAARKKSRAAAVGAGLRGLCRVQNLYLRTRRTRRTTSSRCLFFLLHRHVTCSVKIRCTMLNFTWGEWQCRLLLLRGLRLGLWSLWRLRRPCETERIIVTTVRDDGMYLWSSLLFLCLTTLVVRVHSPVSWKTPCF
jgi:hypothetical protein